MKKAKEAREAEANAKALAATNGNAQTVQKSRQYRRDEDRGAILVSSEVVFEVVCALHLAAFVESPFKDRGGLMMVGPPGRLKTSFLDILDDNYHNAVSMSNLNSQTLSKMCPQMYNGEIRSMVFPDIQALYVGDPRTSARLEQALMQLTGESHRGASWQDARFQKFRARCTVFGALTPDMYQQYSAQWELSGFLRRFLWASYTLEDPEVLIRAIQRWEKANIGSIRIPEIPANRSIKNYLNEDQRKEITRWLKHQPGPHEIQLQILCKAASVLYWHYQMKHIHKDAMDTMFEFSGLLQKEAALVDLPKDDE